MTAATKDHYLVQSGTPEELLPVLRSYPMNATSKVYAGTIVGLDTGGNAGPADGTTFANVVGVAERGADNTAAGAADGDVQVLVRRGVFGKFTQTGTAIDKTKIGAKVYAVDDSTLSLASSGNAFAGYVDSIQDGIVMYAIAVHVLGA